MVIKRVITVGYLSILTLLLQGAVTESSKFHYQKAFQELKSMLEDKVEPSFERAVFVTENAHWDGKRSYADFQLGLLRKLQVVGLLADANDYRDTMDFDRYVQANGRFKAEDLYHTPKERESLYHNALGNWAIFKYLTDTVTLYPFQHLPCKYAADDPFGMEDWRNTQVINILDSNKGNCFALSAMYKILADRLEVEADICTAPQHIYIQHKDVEGYTFNVELATAGHPGDGRLQAYTYTSTQAVESGISLRTLTQKQSIGLCLVNLAKSYEHRFNSRDDEFMLQCAELALAHDSLNLNALLLKHQILDQKVTAYAKSHNLTSIEQVRQNKNIKEEFAKLESHVKQLYDYGYIQMPLRMQQIILNGLQNKSDLIYLKENRTPSPFTTFTPKDPEDREVLGITGGLFPEFFAPRPKEKYGHFTYSNKTKKLVEMDIEGKTGFIIDPVAFAYDFGARFYNPRTARFVSVDPLAHVEPGWTPYRAFFNNPIFFVDPTGMLEDDYGLDKKGNITLLRKTDDSNDRLIALDSEGKETSTSIEIDKGVLSSKKTMTVTATNKKQYTFDQYNVKGDKKAQEIFEFTAKNSNVEWSLSKIGAKKGEHGKSILTTSHKNRSEIGAGYLKANGYTFREHTHSHPNHPRPSAADMRFAKSLNKKFPKAVLDIYYKGRYIPYDQYGVIIDTKLPEIKVTPTSK